MAARRGPECTGHDGDGVVGAVLHDDGDDENQSAMMTLRILAKSTRASTICAHRPKKSFHKE
jgi:hypothetical protein